MSYNDQMQDLVDRYRTAKQPWPATAKDLAKWAFGNGLWKPHPSALSSQCADDFAKAMREEYVTDPQGRRVRAKHAARIKVDGKQQALWDDIRTADRDHMESALQQRRGQVVGDCVQLRVDADSYNDNSNPNKPIQISLDFTKDVEEELFVADAA